MRRSAGPPSRHSSEGDTAVPADRRSPNRQRRKNKRKKRRRMSPRWIGFVLSLICLFMAFLWMTSVFVSWVSHPSSGNKLRRGDVDSVAEAKEPIHRDFRAPKFQRYTDNAPPCDHLEADNVSFTLVTQLSTDRLWMMEHHCTRWGNESPISVAILTNMTHSQILDQLIQLGCDSSQLTLQLLSADLYPRDDYPVNVLRNLALSAVTTSHVMYADVDFWESEDLRDLLHTQSIREALAEDPKRALVIPAFMLIRQCREWRECPEANVPRMPRTREEMLHLIKTKHGYPFDPTNRGGHGSTMYGTWIRDQEPGDLRDVPCVFSNRYEPYLAFRYCQLLPPFQEQFSGYGKNKMTMMMHMIRSGYRLSQLGGGYVVHYPHLDSASRMEWNESPQAVQPVKSNGKWHRSKPEAIQGIDWTAYKRGRVDATFVEFRNWLVENVPDESIIPKCQDAEDDDSKLWYDRGQR